MLKWNALLASFCLILFSSSLLQAKTTPPLKIEKQKIFGEVVGPDDRVSMTASEHPWSTIGKVTYIKPNGDSSWCTGTLIYEDLVLTNAHCVLDDDGKLFRNIIFRPNYMRGFAKYGSAANRVWWGKPSGKNDWAILRLNSPLGGQFGYLGVTFPTIDELTSPDWQERLVLAGYSSGWERGQTAGVHLGCSVIGNTDGGFKHDCDTNGGSSGSSLFGYFPPKTEVRVVGLNWGELRGGAYNVGVLTTQFKEKFKELKKSDEGKPQRAYFYACNGGDRTITVAIAHWNETWTTHGWWDVAPGRCREIETPEEDEGTIYVHARDGRAFWGAESSFCISDDAFKIERADKECPTGRKANFNKLEIERGVFTQRTFSR